MSHLAEAGYIERPGFDGVVGYAFGGVAEVTGGGGRGAVSKGPGALQTCPERFSRVQENAAPKLDFPKRRGMYSRRFVAGGKANDTGIYCVPGTSTSLGICKG